MKLNNNQNRTFKLSMFLSLLTLGGKTYSTSISPASASLEPYKAQMSLEICRLLSKNNYNSKLTNEITQYLHRAIKSNSIDEIVDLIKNPRKHILSISKENITSEKKRLIYAYCFCINMGNVACEFYATSRRLLKNSTLMQPSS